MIPIDKIKIGMFVRVLQKRAGSAHLRKDEVKNSVYKNGAYVIDTRTTLSDGFVVVLNIKKNDVIGNYFYPEDIDYPTNDIDVLLGD